MAAAATAILERLNTGVTLCPECLYLKQLRRDGRLMRLWLFVAVVNGPLAALLIADLRDSWASEHRARKHAGHGCMRAVPGIPGGVCGQPATARIDVWHGYEYRFQEWVCDEHTRDARVRQRGFSYRVDDRSLI